MTNVAPSVFFITGTDGPHPDKGQFPSAERQQFTPVAVVLFQQDNMVFARWYLNRRVFTGEILWQIVLSSVIFNPLTTVVATGRARTGKAGDKAGSVTVISFITGSGIKGGFSLRCTTCR